MRTMKLIPGLRTLILIHAGYTYVSGFSSKMPSDSFYIGVSHIAARYLDYGVRMNCVVRIKEVKNANQRS